MIATLSKVTHQIMMCIEEKLNKKHQKLSDMKNKYILRVISFKTRETRDVEFLTMAEIANFGYEHRFDTDNWYFLVKRDTLTQKENIIKLNLQ